MEGRTVEIGSKSMTKECSRDILRLLSHRKEMQTNKAAPETTSERDERL